MTDGELLVEVKRLCALWQQRLGVANWQLHFETSAESGAGALKVTRLSYYRKALVTIWTGVEDADKSPEQLSQNVLHEVCHLLLADIQDAIDQEFDGTGLMFRYFRNAYEVSTDEVKSALWRAWERVA